MAKLKRGKKICPIKKNGGWCFPIVPKEVGDFKSRTCKGKSHKNRKKKEAHKQQARTRDSPPEKREDKKVIKEGWREERRKRKQGN